MCSIIYRPESRGEADWQVPTSDEGQLNYSRKGWWEIWYCETYAKEGLGVEEEGLELELVISAKWRSRRFRVVRW
jgi:hypothetical protein